MKFMRFAAAAIAAAFLTVSCQEKSPSVPGGEGGETPETPGTSVYPQTPMTFTVNGEEIPVGMAFADPFDEYVLFTATPDASVNSYEDAVSADDIEYLQVMLLPQYIGRDIDLVKEPQGVYCWDNETQTTEIYPEILTSGTARMNFNEETGEYTLLMALEFTDGTKVGVNASAVMSGETPDEGNTITIDGKPNPLRAAFYLENSGQTYLYFTRSEVYTFDEMMEMAVEYFYMILDDSAMTGEEIDMTSTDRYFWLGFTDQANGTQSDATSEDLAGATGTFSAKKTGDGTYEVTASVKFGDGKEVSVEFSGKCVSVDYQPEEPNQFTYGGYSQKIKSALVDKSDPDIWHIYLSEVGGLETVGEFEEMCPVHITAPAEGFNIGDGIGFSTYKDGSLKFEYEGETWQWADDGSMTGSLEAYLEGDMLEVDFTTYGDLSGHYSGTAVIVE